MTTIVYVQGKKSEDDAVVFYKDNKKIGRFSPLPTYGNEIEDIIFGLTGEKPEVVTVPQIGEQYPESLEEIKSWK